MKIVNIVFAIALIFLMLACTAEAETVPLDLNREYSYKSGEKKIKLVLHKGTYACEILYSAEGYGSGSVSIDSVLPFFDGVIECRDFIEYGKNKSRIVKRALLHKKHPNCSCERPLYGK